MSSCIRAIGVKCGCLEPPRPPNRTVMVGHHVPPDSVQLSADQKFCSNRVRTARYTIWSFLPKNLFEQFKRIANFYFLCVAIVSLLIDSPVSPTVSILPLAFVIIVTMVKQGYENYLRYKEDKDVNNRLFSVVREQRLVQLRSFEIQVGDLVRVEDNTELPCDMVLLSSPHDEGQCYVMTANLDGETNLKEVLAVPPCRAMLDEAKMGALRAAIVCKQPTVDLDEFTGNIDLYDSNWSSSSELPLARENMLLRGAKLKNTPFVFGCAVYTGQETKMALNSKPSAHKFSRIERSMNYYLVTFLVLLLVESVVSEALYFWHRSRTVVTEAWYLPSEKEQSLGLRIVEKFLSFMVLYNYVIPISLYVTIELQKFFGSLFFNWDVEMYDAGIDEPAKANTSDLNEELGQVQYLFTDKTGTLTENDMQFRQCWAGGVNYHDREGRLYRSDDSAFPVPLNQMEPQLVALMRVLVLCHTGRMDSRPESNGHSTDSAARRRYEYQSSSPDEKAFLEAAASYGIVYEGLQDGVARVSFFGTTRSFHMLHTLEFDSDRKCMSVLVKDEQGEHWLLTKGAETAIFSRSTELTPMQQLTKQVNEYAMLGLRTLVIAQRQLSVTEYAQLDEQLQTARKALQDRPLRLQEAFAAVEQNLSLLGATAVEDRLQDGVPDTIVNLRKAGIKVWVLTGDKEETAVNISYSCGHFSRDMTDLRMTKLTTQHEIETRLGQCQRRLLRADNDERCYINPSMRESSESLRDERGPFCLVVDGPALKGLLNEGLREKFLRLCLACSTVLCCRMSPLQKAEVVRLVKHSAGSPVTAAIGDGANDCSMIMEAHVGLGIFGKEGRQAVRTADYAFGRFRFLQRALLVHGHYYYVRLATLVQYFFYKNVAFCTSQLYFAIFSAWTQQSIFDTIPLMLFNITSTSLPILCYGLQEQHLPQAALVANPSLYQEIANNARLSIKQFLRWNLMGFYHSLVFFFGVYLWYGTTGAAQTSDGKLFGIDAFGIVLYFGIIIGVNIKLAIETYYWTGLTHFCFWGTIVFAWLFFYVFNSTIWPETIIFDVQPLYGVLTTALSSAGTWLLLLLVLVAALSPDLCLRAFSDTLRYGSHLSACRGSRIMKSLSFGNNQVTTSGPGSPRPIPLSNLSTVDTVSYRRLGETTAPSTPVVMQQHV